MTPRPLVICCLIGALLISGCSSFHSDERRVRERVHAFMQARLTRNDTRVRTFLAAAYHRRYANEDPTTLIGDSEPHYHRYRLLGLTQIGAEAWRATVRIEIHARGFYPIGWITEEIDLAPMQGEWQVTRVTRLETHTYTDTAR